MFFINYSLWKENLLFVELTAFVFLNCATLVSVQVWHRFLFLLIYLNKHQV